MSSNNLLHTIENASTMLVLAPTATLPTNVDEVLTLGAAECCPCDMGVFGACGSGLRDCALPGVAAHNWRIAWAALLDGDLTVVDPWAGNRLPIRAERLGYQAVRKALATLRAGA